MHFVGADQLHGFEQRLTTDIYPADFGWTGDWTEVRQRHSNDPRTFTRAGVCARNPQMEYDDEVTHRTVRKLYDLARARDPRPFFLTVSFTHPHDPYQCSQEHWDRYRHNDIDMPVVGGDDARTLDPYSLRLRAQYGLDQYTPDDDVVRIARHAYYGSISYIDDQLGELMKTLELTGLDKNLIVVFTSDHGDMMGERGLWYKKSFFESSVRVPLIIKVPHLPGRRIKQHVSLVDLLPTLLELGAVNQESALVEESAGVSLCAALRGDGLSPDRAVYSEILAEGAMAPILMVVKGRYKYVCSGSDPEQLYDIREDERELDNLVEDATHEAHLNELRSLASRQWDVTELTARVRLSQRRRLFIAGLTGRGNAWDYCPSDQLRDQCLRANKSYNAWAYDDVVPTSQ